MSLLPDAAKLDRRDEALGDTIIGGNGAHIAIIGANGGDLSLGQFRHAMIGAARGFAEANSISPIVEAITPSEILYPVVCSHPVFVERKASACGTVEGFAHKAMNVSHTRARAVVERRARVSVGTGRKFQRPATNAGHDAGPRFDSAIQRPKATFGADFVSPFKANDCAPFFHSPYARRSVGRMQEKINLPGTPWWGEWA